MKTTIFSVPTMFLLISTAFNSPSVSTNEPAKETRETAVKQGAGFTFFRTHRQGKGITATWGMASYAGVAGFTIQRTYDFDPSDPNAVWEPFPVVSGNAGRSVSYTDNEASAGFIHYRVVAKMTNGSSEVSEISTVRIVSRK